MEKKQSKIKFKGKSKGIKKGWDFTKPAVKGTVLTFIGLIITRMEVGFGRFSTNLIYGVISYLFIAISGLFLIELIKASLSGKSEITKLKFRLFIFISVLYSIGFVTFLLNIIVNNLNVLIILLPVILGILYIVLCFYIFKKGNEEIGLKIFPSLIFGYGILYGGFMNVLFSSAYIYVFFIAVFSLQIAREKIKNLANQNNLNIRENGNYIEEELKSMLILEMIALAGLIIPIFLGIRNPIMYLYPLVIYSCFLGIVIFLTHRSMKEKQVSDRINILTKIALVFQLIAIVLSS